MCLHMGQHCFPLHLFDWTHNGQAGTRDTNWLRDQIVDVFAMYVFVWEMHLNKKYLKRIVHSVPKWNSIEEILSGLLMDSLADSGGFIHYVAVSEVLQQCRCA